MKRQLVWKIFLVLVISLFLVSCGGGNTANDTTADTTTEEKLAPADQLYVFLPKSLDNPYWDDCRLGMEDLAAELGVQAEFLGPATADAAQQVAIFESVIARNPVGIAVSPNDPATVEAAIAMAMEAGIPVFAWDADAPNSIRLAYIGTNNVEAGKVAGEELAKAINYEGKVAILHGSLSAQNAIERVTGFEEAIAQYPDIEIVATEPTEDAPDIALTKAETLLQAYPDLDGFYGVTGSGVPGAAGAVQAAGLCEQVAIVGFDVVPQGIEAMQNNCVTALISQRPYGMTQQTLQMLYDMYNSGWEPDADNYDTGVEVVYPDTLEEFLSTPH